MRTLKYLYFILILVLTLSVSVFAYAEDASDSIEYNEGKAQILKMLNIIDDGILENETVSRISFLKSVCAIMTDKTLNDIEAYNIGVDYGLVAADEYAKFRAQDPIKGYEALKIIVCALGRDIVAEQNGGYPFGYVTEGKKAGFSVSELGNENITVDVAVNILAKAIDSDVTIVDTFGADGYISYKKIDDSLIHYYRKMNLIEGIVTANEYTSLDNPDRGVKKRIGIDGITYKFGFDTIDINPLLGYPVTVYVDENNIICAIAIDDRNLNEITVRYDDIDNSEIGENRIKYYNGKKNDTIKLSPVLDVIYNGKSIPDYTMNDLNPQQGFVTFIDNDGDEIYDVVDVKDYELYMVNYASGKTKLVNNQYDKAEPKYLELGETDTEYSFILDGEKIKLVDLKNGDIILVSVSKTGNEKIVRGLVTRNKINGKIITVDESENSIIIETDEGNKTEYKLNPLYVIEQQNRRNAILTGVNAEIAFDAMGEVAYIKAKKDNIFVYAKYIDFDKKGNKVGVKYLDSSNVWKYVEFAEKVQCNGVRMDADKAFASLGGDDFTEKLMRIELNGEGKIKYIAAPDTVVYGDEKFVESKTISEYWYRQNFSFNWNVYLADSAPVFIVPQNPSSDEDMYMAATPGDLKSGSNYSAKIYNLDDFDMAEAAVVYDSLAVDNNSEWFVVTNKLKVFENEEITARIYSKMGNDTTKTVRGKNEEVLQNVNIGDVIRFSLDLKNRIKSEPTKIFDAEIGPQKSAPSNLHGDSVISKGFLTDIDAVNHKLRIDIGKSVVYNVPETINFYIYNITDNVLSQGTITDLREGDFMILSYYYSDIQKIMAIRY